MKNKENIIGRDFQGWPIYKKTLRELLEELGAEYMDEGKRIIGFPDDNPILDIIPTTLEDDGMGYGVEERYLIGADYDKRTNLLHIWRDVAQVEKISIK